MVSPCPSTVVRRLVHDMHMTARGFELLPNSVLRPFFHGVCNAKHLAEIHWVSYHNPCRTSISLPYEASADLTLISCSSFSATLRMSRSACTFCIISSNLSITAGVGSGMRSGTPIWLRIAAILSVCIVLFATRGFDSLSEAKVMVLGSLSCC